MLQRLASMDLRLQVFKAPQRSGYIGKMKFRAGSLALGQWIVELDHDDRMHRRLFEWIRDIAVVYPSTTFIYSDGVQVGEENDNPFTYGDYYGFHHGSYVRQHLRSHQNAPLQPHYISRSGWMNPVTLRHLIGLPNHVHVWNKAFYDTIGGHRQDPSVADDYDILIKTFLAPNSLLLTSSVRGEVDAFR